MFQRRRNKSDNTPLGCVDKYAVLEGQVRRREGKWRQAVCLKLCNFPTEVPEREPRAMRELVPPEEGYGVGADVGQDLLEVDVAQVLAVVQRVEPSKALANAGATKVRCDADVDDVRARLEKRDHELVVLL